MAQQTLKSQRGGARSNAVDPRVMRGSSADRGGDPREAQAETKAARWQDVPVMTRALIGVGFLGMIINDLWHQTARNVFALDPMRPDLHQFVTLAFFTFGFVPFVLNSAVVLLAGSAVERSLGKVQTFIIYVASAILGGIGYIALSNFEWSAGPLPAASVAAMGLIGACLYLRMQVWNEDPVLLMGRWNAGWGELAGIISIYSGVIVLFWVTELYAMCTGAVVISHGFGLFAGLSVAAVTDWLDQKVLPARPQGSRRPSRPAPEVPFPKTAAVHPFSGAVQSREDFAHETTETVPKKKEGAGATQPAVQAAPAQAAMATEFYSAPPPAAPPPPPVDPQIKAIVHEINACNPAHAYRLYREWQSVDVERCLEPANQWRLAQLLTSAQNIEGAVSVLKRLLGKYPACYWVAQARAELGFIYARMVGRRQDAVEQLLAGLRVRETGEEEGPHPLTPQAAERARSTLRDLGYELPLEKSVASPGPMRDKIQETDIMAKKNLPPTGPKPQVPEPNDSKLNSYSNLFGDPEATGNFAPLGLEDEAPVKVPKTYGGDQNAHAEAPRAAAPPPPPANTAGAKKAPPPPPASGSDDPFTEQGESGVFKQSLWEDESKKQKKEIKYTAPAGSNVGLDESKPIVFDEDTPGPGPNSKDRGLTEVFGSPTGTASLAPPNWSDVAGTGSIPADIGQSLGDPNAAPPMPDQGMNSAPFWNRSSPFMFPEEDKGPPKKRPMGEDRFNTPPPSSPHLAGSGEKARPLKKREIKDKDDIDFFPTPVPFTAKPAEDVFNTPPAPVSAVPKPTARNEDRFATPPPKPAPIPEPRIVRPENSSPSSAAGHGAPASHGGTDVWSAFLKEDRGWSEQPASPHNAQTVQASAPHPPAPPASPPASSKASAPPPGPERMINDSAPTVQRPAAHPVAPAPKEGAEIGFIGSSPDQTMVWSQQYASERNPTFSPSSKYNIIIAPASSLMVREIIGMLRVRLGMNEEAALYALKHRHGILLSDTGLDDAVDLCHKFAEQGQDVALVEQDERLEFGEPADVMRIKSEEKTARYFTMDAAYTRKWKELIGLACGRVAIHPGAPGRDVLDLYFAQPGLNLRIWRNTLMSAPPMFTGKVENEAEFQALARELVKRAPHAIQTQSFIEWTQAATPAMPIEFSNMVEYQNYTRWYLMAHYGRSKLFGPGKK